MDAGTVAIGWILGVLLFGYIVCIIEEHYYMKKKLYHSKAWLKLQRSKGKTVTDIARECGVSAQIIDVYLKKYGLK